MPIVGSRGQVLNCDDFEGGTINHFSAIGDGTEVLSYIDSTDTDTDRGINGILRMTTAGADNNSAGIATRLAFRPKDNYQVECEFRYRKSSSAGDLCFGFADVRGDQVSDIFDGTATVVTPAASDYALLGWANAFNRTEGLRPLWRGGLVNPPTDVAKLVKTKDYTNGIFYIVRVKMTQAGHVHFYVDDEEVQAVENAIDPEHYFCALAIVQASAGAAVSFDLDYAAYKYMRGWTD